MSAKIPAILGYLALLNSYSFAAQSIIDNNKFCLALDSYLRLDAVSFRNVYSLDRTNKQNADTNKQDSADYLGLDYSFSFCADLKDQASKLFLKMERNGPYDYSAPLFIHNKLVASETEIHPYKNEDLLPQIEEIWGDFSLKGLRFKAGIYTYEVGGGLALNGGYENLGISLYSESQTFPWRLHYSKPDIVNDLRLGPSIKQEYEQGIKYEHNSANFFAADVKLERGNHCVFPYVGVLADYTSSGKRGNTFITPVENDILGTIGSSWAYKQGNLNFNFEAARNFGRAESSSPEFKDIIHCGYMVYGGMDYTIDKIKPSLQIILCSGNKVNEEMALNADEYFAGSKNRAFSYYSPLNSNLGDAIASSNCEICPIVAMGCGWGLNYGVPRPGTFSSSDYDNLIMPVVGMEFNLTKRLCLSIYNHYLSAFEPGVGTFNGEAKILSRDLGFESDCFVDYRLNDSICLQFSFGYFIPGKYYKEQRDDTSGSIFSPYVRGDGTADPAHQFEASMEMKF